MRWRWALVCGWSLVILGLCWWPKEMMPAPEGGGMAIYMMPLDKIVHFGVFLGFAALLAHAILRDGWARFRVVVLAGMAFAVISELGQLSPLVNRDAGLDDLTADMLGVLAGWAAGTLFDGFRPSVIVPSPGRP